MDDWNTSVETRAEEIWEMGIPMYKTSLYKRCFPGIRFVGCVGFAASEHRGQVFHIPSICACDRGW